MKMERHNCGGTLRHTQVTLTRNIGGLLFTFDVPGKQCSVCSEEVISYDTAHELETRLLGAWEFVYKRRGQLFSTLNAPIIHLPSMGTAINDTNLSPVTDTGRVAYAF